MLSFISSFRIHKKQSENDAIIAFFSSCVVAILVLMGLSEWLIREHVLPQDTLATHLRLLHGADASNAAFGDSHAARGFNAVDGFINLSYPSENIQDMAAKVALYFSENEPDRVILQADPHLFAPYRVHAGQKTYGDLAQFEILSKRHRARVLLYWETYLRAGGHLESKVKMTEAGSLLSEGDLSQVPSRKRMFEAQIRRSWHQIEESEAVAMARIDYVSMLDALSARGARLCLLSYPVSDDYMQAVKSAGHEIQIAFFQKEAARIGARFVDARGAVQNRRFFRDVDHLNQAGAREFSPGLLDACFGKVE